MKPRSDLAQLRVSTVVVVVTILMALPGCGRPEPGPAAKPVDQSRAKSQYDAGVLEAAIAASLATLDSLGTPLKAASATSREDVIATFDGLGFAVNDELQILWSEVAPTDDRSAFLFGYRLLSAAGARARYDALRDDPDVSWRPNWVPVLEADDHWLVVESSRSTAPAGPVVAFRRGESPEVVFTNLTRFFEATATALADPTTRVEGGRLRVDPDVFRRAHGATNAGLTLPAHVLEP